MSDLSPWFPVVANTVFFAAALSLYILGQRFRRADSELSRDTWKELDRRAAALDERSRLLDQQAGLIDQRSAALDKRSELLDQLAATIITGGKR